MPDPGARVDAASPVPERIHVTADMAALQAALDEFTRKETRYRAEGYCDACVYRRMMDTREEKMEKLIGLLIAGGPADHIALLRENLGL